MKPHITVISLGPGDPSLLTLQAAEALRSAKNLVLRTARHPVAEWLRGQGIFFSDLDAFYTEYEDFDEMHRAMAEHLWKLAENGAVSFGVMNPDADGAVRFLRESVPENGDLRVLPGVSAGDVCLSSLPADCPEDDAFRQLPATAFLSVPDSPGQAVLITEINDALLAGEVKLRLTALRGEEQTVFFFPPGNRSPRACRPIPLYLLDAQHKYDHTAAVYVPGTDYLHRDKYTFDDLSRIVARLRAPDGCPWDSVQTHQSLRPFIVEEAWETVSAIDEQDDAHLADELGDVLFQVFIHASIGEDFDEFDMTDIVSSICAKMIQRHPRVFGDRAAESTENLSGEWERLKRKETGSKTVGASLNDVSESLPSLKYAIKTYKKLAQVPALRREPEIISREIRELAAEIPEDGVPDEEQISLLLLKCTELCYRENLDAEILLHGITDRLKRVYQEMENRIFLDKKNPENLTNQQLRVYLKHDEENIIGLSSSKHEGQFSDDRRNEEDLL